MSMRLIRKQAGIQAARQSRYSSSKVSKFLLIPIFTDMNRLIRFCLVMICLALSGNTLLARAYYFSPKGNDADAGITLARAWKSLDKLNNVQLKSGDSVFLSAGDTFTASLYFDATDRGKLNSRIYIGSTDSSVNAIIRTVKDFGLYGYNCSGFLVEHLTIIEGTTGSNTYGFQLYSDDTGKFISQGWTFKGCKASGFSSAGFYFFSYGTRYGFSNLIFDNCESSYNKSAGFTSYSQYLKGHRNIIVRNCIAHHCFGRKDVTNSNSGSGIVFAGLDSALIEYCEAYQNGRDNSHYGGGPCGIWVYNSNRVMMQHNRAHHNQAGLEADGSGFDFDGGTTNSVMQYNISYYNEGAGLEVAQYDYAPPMYNNAIRYNISYNDGRKNGNAGILIYAGIDSLHDYYIHNNAIYSDDKNLLDSNKKSRGIVYTHHLRNVYVWNNYFLCNKAELLASFGTDVDTAEISFRSNIFHEYNTPQRVIFADKAYKDLNSFLINSKWQGLARDNIFGKPNILLDNFIGMTYPDSTPPDIEKLFRLRGIYGTRGADISPFPFILDSLRYDYYHQTLSKTGLVIGIESATVLGAATPEARSPDVYDSRIYPNPVQAGDMLRVRAESNRLSASPYQLSLYDAQGRSLLSVNHTAELHLPADLPSGIYILRIASDNPALEAHYQRIIILHP